MKDLATQASMACIDCILRATSANLVGAPHSGEDANCSIETCLRRLKYASQRYECLPRFGESLRLWIQKMVPDTHSFTHLKYIHSTKEYTKRSTVMSPVSRQSLVL